MLDYVLMCEYILNLAEANIAKAKKQYYLINKGSYPKTWDMT
jgi:hypothetical protein